MTHDHDLPELPDDPELERATRDLLRNDPLEIDLDRREQAISAALDAAAEPAPAAPQTVVPLAPRRERHARRSRAVRPVLVAAATIAVLAGGVLTVAQLADSGSGSEDLASQGAAVDELGSADESGGTAESDTSPGSGSADGADQGAFAPTTTGPPTVASGTAVTELGEYPDVAALLSAAGRAAASDRAREEDGAPTGPESTMSRVPAACEPELSDLDATPSATATVAGVPVLVVRVPDGTTVVLRVSDCAEVGRG